MSDSEIVQVNIKLKSLAQQMKEALTKLDIVVRVEERVNNHDDTLTEYDTRLKKLEDHVTTLRIKRAGGDGANAVKSKVSRWAFGILAALLVTFVSATGILWVKTLGG